MREILEAQRAATDQAQRDRGVIVPWVFHRDGAQIKSIRTGWKLACLKAGVPGRIPHDFRRTAVRNLVSAGVPEKTAMLMTGHKTRSVFDRYHIINEQDKMDAVDKLERSYGSAK